MRIVKLLGDSEFSLRLAEYINTHKLLFEGLMVRNHEFTGIIRTTNIKKKEFVLNDDSVEYGFAPTILATLEYEFKLESEVSYDALTSKQRLQNIIKFMSSIWQVHPFKEGNTRTTALFILRYLMSFNYQIDGMCFKLNSKYFRNALVRSQYANNSLNIKPTFKFLYLFFENAIFNANHKLSDYDLKL